MKHVVTCQADTASDWLTLASLRCFTEWVGLCVMDNPPATTDAPRNAAAQPWPHWSMYMLDIDASTDTTYVFTCEPCN